METDVKSALPFGTIYKDNMGLFSGTKNILKWPPGMHLEKQ